MFHLINKIESMFHGSKKVKPFNDSGHIKPSRDWKVLLIINFLIICALASFSFYFYLEVEKGTFFKIESTESLGDVKINNILLNKVVDEINKRETSLDSIRNKTIVIPSPTL